LKLALPCCLKTALAGDKSLVSAEGGILSAGERRLRLAAGANRQPVSAGGRAKP